MAKSFDRLNFLFTSESVSAAHPDKVCDQISDAIVDEVLRQDQMGRAAIETLVTENCVVVAGEINFKGKINIKQIASDQIKRLGYCIPELKFTYKSPINVYVHQQSKEIAVGVERQGAGDQGMMFGFACSDNERYMPMPITLAHDLTRKLDETRNSKSLDYLRPDGKSQVTIEYKDGKPIKVVSVVMAVAHNKNVGAVKVKKDVYETIVVPVLGKYGYQVSMDQLVVNGTGSWHYSGPAADTGVTGRKIIVDTYGGFARVGGGAFSGKDPTKVDRSGAYAARFLAKNIVAHKFAQKAEISLAYYIGAKKPVMVEVETFGTESKSKKNILNFVESILHTSVEGILSELNLRRPIYLPTAAYGHFGRDEFPWEKIVH